jgi:hypothetical protein
MPVNTIGPDQYIALKYTPRKGRMFEFELESDRPVKTYVVGPKAFQNFADGGTRFKYWGGFPDPRKLQRQKVWIPFSGPVFLIISNPNNESVEVDYDVYF